MEILRFFRRRSSCLFLGFMFSKAIPVASRKVSSVLPHRLASVTTLVRWKSMDLRTAVRVPRSANCDGKKSPPRICFDVPLDFCATQPHHHPYLIATNKTQAGDDELLPSEHKMRKSCDYCVRMKRACDGKTPCELCTR